MASDQSSFYLSPLLHFYGFAAVQHSVIAFCLSSLSRGREEELKEDR